MNLALSALLIILFLLPAFFFRIGLFLPMTRKNEDAQIIHDIISRNVSKALSKLNFTETVFLFSIIPLVLHSGSLLILSLMGANVDYSLLLNIFAGKQNVLTGGSNSIFQHELLSFLAYTLGETILACIFGWVLFKCLGGKKMAKEPEESNIITSTSFHTGYGKIIHIPGDIFTIFGKEIINLNVKYIN
jgi:hypothetical protein